MKKFAVALLISLFLGTGTVLAGGGDLDTPQQQTMSQTKVVVITEDNWVGPAIGAAGAVLAAGLGLWGIRRRSRKGD